MKKTSELDVRGTLDFKPLGFEGFRKEVGLNHNDIAFKFAA